MRGARRARPLAALALVLPLAACGSDADGGSQGTLTVLAAARLTETFTGLAHTFEAEHHGVEGKLVFGPCTTPAQPVLDGPPRHVLAPPPQAA